MYTNVNTTYMQTSHVNTRSRAKGFIRHIHTTIVTVTCAMLCIHNYATTADVAVADSQHASAHAYEEAAYDDVE